MLEKLAVIEGTDFSSGVIEAEIAGAPEQGATEGARELFEPIIQLSLGPLSKVIRRAAPKGHLSPIRERQTISP